MGLFESLEKIKKKVNRTKDVDFFGSSVTLRILTAKEEDNVSNLEGEEKVEVQQIISNMRKNILAYALHAVDGEVFPDVIVSKDSEGNEKKQTKFIFVLEYLSTLSTSFVDSLFDSYLDFKEESNKEVLDNFKWEWYKTPEQREKEYEEKAKKLMKKNQQEDSDDESEEVEDINFRKIEVPEGSEKKEDND